MNNPLVEGFLLGIISTCSVIAGLFFLKFWRRTRDFLFLAFGLSFLVEGLNRAAVLLILKPSQGSAWIYIVRMLGSILILSAIVRKNYSTSQ